VVPTIAARLRSMMKAMQEVVLPAVDTQNAIAQEQAKLVIGSLNLILQQLDLAHRFEIVEAREKQAEGRELATILEAHTPRHPVAIQSAADIAAQSSVIDDPLSALTALHASNQCLRGVIANLIQASEDSGDLALINRMSRRVISYGETQLIRERSWVATTGFDPPGATIPLTDALQIKTAQGDFT
jgi:hypothetical protein